MFTIGSVDTEKRNITFDKYVNDDELWNIKFFRVEDYIDTEVDVVRCNDLIESWTHLPDDEIEMLLREVPIEGLSLCPNTTTFRLTGGIWGPDYLKL